MSSYLVPKDTLVQIITDDTLVEFIPDLCGCINRAQDLLYRAAQKYKNCCQRDWKAVRSQVVELVQFLKKHKEAATRFREYMIQKHNLVASQKILFFFRHDNKLINELC